MSALCCVQHHLTLGLAAVPFGDFEEVAASVIHVATGNRMLMVMGGKEVDLSVAEESAYENTALVKSWL